MKVRAKQAGQYKGLMYHPGQVFEIDETEPHYPAHWMDPIVKHPTFFEEQPEPKKTFLERLGIRRKKK